MARPKKQGFEYFPLDVDFFESPVAIGMAQRYGTEGVSALVCLLCMIYRNGYYLEWNEFMRMKMMRDLGDISEETLEMAVNQLVEWGFFHRELYECSSVLTSLSLQEQYREMCVRSKRESSIGLYGINADGSVVFSEKTADDAEFTPKKRSTSGVSSEKTQTTTKKSRTKRILSSSNTNTSEVSSE